MTVANECSVCYSSDQIITTNCGHHICFECLYQGYKNYKMNGCPVCRSNIDNLISCEVDINDEFLAIYGVDISNGEHYHPCILCEHHDNDQGYDRCPEDHITDCNCYGVDKIRFFVDVDVSEFPKKAKLTLWDSEDCGEDYEENYEGFPRICIHLTKYDCCDTGVFQSPITFKICDTCNSLNPCKDLLSPTCVKCEGLC